MKKLIVVVMMMFLLVGCEIATPVVEETPENEYESDYVRDYSFPVAIMNEVYYNYHDVFAGFYLIEGAYQVNITEDAPQLLIDRLNQSSLVSHHFVEFSYSELWAIHEMIGGRMGIDGIHGSSVSESDNTVLVHITPGNEIPSFLDHYIERGIVTVEFRQPATAL